MKNNGKMLLVITLIVLLAAALIGGGIGVTQMRNRRIYTEKIEAGDKYLAAGDYDNAVLMYQDAIRRNDKEETGYLKLANAYGEQNYYALAVGVLEKGYDKTKSSRIQEMLLVYKNLDSTGGVQAQKDPLLNKSLLSKLNGSSYGDYAQRNEVESVQTGAGGEAIVRLKGISAELIFLPAVYIGGQVSADAFPSEVRFDNLIGLFGVNGSVTRAQLQTMEFDSIDVIDDGGTGYQLHLVYLGSNIYIPCDKDGTFMTDTVSVMEPQFSGTVTEGGRSGGTTMNGYVEDAQSGSGLPNATLTIYEGTSKEGEPAAVVTTDESGSYSVDLESGQYLVEIVKDGYVSVDKEVYLGSYSSEQQEVFILSAESAGEIRIVLEWSGGSCDLDSYLDGSGGLLKFSNREIYSGGELAAALDRDSRSAPGVETTTIYDTNGSYEFFVFDYMLSGTMQSSGATVTIYVPGESPQTVSIPSDAGNTWHVCTISGGQVSITNYMTEEQSSYQAK